MLIKITGFLNVSRYANDNGNFVPLSIGLRCQILKIVLELVLDLELELPEHLAPEPRCILWPWVSQRHS